MIARGIPSSHRRKKMPEGNEVRIYLQGGGCCVDSPVNVNRGQSLKFRNELDTGKVVIFFPRLELVGRYTLELPAGGGSGSVGVKGDAPLGEHVYAVFCGAVNDFGIGCSHPKIIINL
jgi:hypothetical protein